MLKHKKPSNLELLFSHQQPDGGQADIEFLVLQAKTSSYIHDNLEAGARHCWQEVCHHQLQALEGSPDQGLAGRNNMHCAFRDATLLNSVFLHIIYVHKSQFSQLRV